MSGVLTAAVVQEDLAAFVADASDGFGHPRQREHARTYVRGLIEAGGRKSLQPTLFRLGACGLDGVDARYQSVQQFLADSPWDPAVIVRACAERVAPRLEVASNTSVSSCRPGSAPTIAERLQ